MRLIDADEVITRAKEEAVAMSEPFKSQFGLLVEWIVGKTSTAYDVDKVVEQLEEFREETEQFHVSGMLSDIIEVVKGGGAVTGDYIGTDLQRGCRGRRTVCS